MLKQSKNSCIATILVVDDVAICREPIEMALQHHGYATLSAANGAEAMRILHAEKPDLVLLDMEMPEMDGLTVLGAIRASPILQKTPVIFLTNKGKRVDVQQAAAWGVGAYILKSNFTMDALLDKIRQSLESAKLAAIAASRESSPIAVPAAPAVTASRPPEPAAAPGRNLRKAPIAGSEPPTRTGSSIPKSEVIARIRSELDLRPMPPVLQFIVAQTRSDTSALDEVVKAIRQDQALAIRIMRVANSSFYASAKRASNLLDATQRIGMSGIRNAITAIVAIDHFANASEGGIVPQRFWEHSLATASLAQSIAEAVSLGDAEELFLAGLLHDIGRLCLGSTFPVEYQRVLAQGRERDVDLVQVEQEVFGLHHGDVTREVLTILGFSEGVIAAASLHERAPLANHSARNALVVSLANRIAHAMLLGDSGNSVLLPIQDCADAFGFKGTGLAAIARATAEKASDTELFYAAQTGVAFLTTLPTQLAETARVRPKVMVFSEYDGLDPVSLFFEQLGWVDSSEPQVAIVHASSAQGWSDGLAKVKLAQQKLAIPLGVLSLVPMAIEATPPPLARELASEVSSIPIRYATLIGAVGRLCRD